MGSWGLQNPKIDTWGLGGYKTLNYILGGYKTLKYIPLNDDIHVIRQVYDNINKRDTQLCNDYLTNLKTSYKI